MEFEMKDFVRESNRIEGINREPTQQEIEAHIHLMSERNINRDILSKFVAIVQPGAVLRDRKGLDVRVGSHVAPPGGPGIVSKLAMILYDATAGDISAYETHLKYETLHPFTDGNGRSGRALWLWQMQKAPLGFLHKFYYQTLDALR